MKKLLTLLIAITLCSCVQSQKKTRESELEVATTNAENSPVVETKCFLDFQFGMTEKEVDDHLYQMYKAKKIYLNKARQYQYDFEFKGMTILLNFHPEYFDGQLYKMTYPCNVDWTGGSGHVFLLTAFHESKSNFRGLINTDILGDTYYTNYKDNMIITFKEFSMIYENAPISKLAKQKEQGERDTQYEQSKSEF